MEPVREQLFIAARMETITDNSECNHANFFLTNKNCIS